MHHIIYLSTAIQPFSRDGILDILSKSRKFNSENNITGCLFWKDDLFLQVIEGEQSSVEFLMSKIVRDPRHTGIIELFNEEKPRREFPAWKMGFYDFNRNIENIPESFLDVIIRNPSISDVAHYPEKVKAFLSLYIEKYSFSSQPNG